MKGFNIRRISSFFIVLLLCASGLSYAHEVDSDSSDNACNKHVQKMAKLIRKFHQVNISIKAAESDLDVLKMKGDSLTEEEQATKTQLVNEIRNLNKKHEIHLDALNSKSERVINHCTE